MLLLMYFEESSSSKARGPGVDKGGSKSVLLDRSRIVRCLEACVKRVARLLSGCRLNVGWCASRVGGFWGGRYSVSHRHLPTTYQPVFHVGSLCGPKPASFHAKGSKLWWIRTGLRSAQRTLQASNRFEVQAYSTLRCKIFARNSATASRRAMSFLSLASTLPTACMTVV